MNLSKELKKDDQNDFKTNKMIDIKKEIANDYLNHFNGLSHYSKTLLLNILGPFIIGLELAPSPHSENSFKPYFVCYSLFENSLKECLNSNLLLLTVLRLNKNIEYSKILYDINSKDYIESILSIKEQFNSFIDNNVSCDFFLNTLDFWLKKERILPMDDIKIYVIKYSIALYLNDVTLIQRVLNDIHKKKKKWPSIYFAWKYGSLDGWIQYLENYSGNRESFMFRIQENRKEKKIMKLKVSEIIT